MLHDRCVWVCGCGLVSVRVRCVLRVCGVGTPVHSHTPRPNTHRNALSPTHTHTHYTHYTRTHRSVDSSIAVIIVQTLGVATSCWRGHPTTHDHTDTHTPYVTNTQKQQVQHTLRDTTPPRLQQQHTTQHRTTQHRTTTQHHNTTNTTQHTTTHRCFLVHPIAHILNHTRRFQHMFITVHRLSTHTSAYTHPHTNRRRVCVGL